MKNLIKVLLPLGFNEKQAQIYISAVSLGDCLISEVAKKSNINRITAYDIIEKLEAKKIVKTYTKKRMKYINAISPQELLENFQTYTSELADLINEFPTPNKKQNHNSVEIHEEKSALPKILKEIADNDSDIKLILSQNCLSKIIPDHNKYLNSLTKNHKIEILSDINPIPNATHSQISTTEIPMISNTIIIIQNDTTFIIEHNNNQNIITKVKNNALSQTYQQLFHQYFTPEENHDTQHHPIKNALFKKLKESPNETPVDNNQEKADNMTLF